MEQGLTIGLLSIIRPPKGLEGCAPLSLEDCAILWRLRENGLKMASLAESFEGLYLCYEKVASTHAALVVKVERAYKEKAVMDAKVKELGEKVTKLESKLSVSEAAVELSLKTQASLEAKAKQKDDNIAELQRKVTELLEALLDSVGDALNNAVSQARVLNLNLITEGMDFTNIVKDGKIVPCMPESGMKATRVRRRMMRSRRLRLL